MTGREYQEKCSERKEERMRFQKKALSAVNTHKLVNPGLHCPKGNQLSAI